MTNGFYDVSHFTKADIRKFCREAINKAYLVRCQTKYKDSDGRGIDKDVNLEYMLKSSKLILSDRTLYVVDRTLYHPTISTDILGDPYEILLANREWEFVYIYVNKDNFDKLITKYKLKLKYQ